MPVCIVREIPSYTVKYYFNFIASLITIIIVIDQCYDSNHYVF